MHSFFKAASKRHNKQWHPLFIGAERGSLPLCERVVERNGDVNPSKQIDGFTAFGFAAQKGHLEISLFMIKHLGDKNPREIDGRTPLHHAAQSGHL